MSSFLKLEQNQVGPTAPARIRRLVGLGGGLLALVLLVTSFHRSSQRPAIVIHSSKPAPTTFKLLAPIAPFLDAARMSVIQESCARVGRHAPRSDMAIAHMMAVHNNDSIVSLGLLLQEIYDPVDTYVIHVKKGITSPWLAPLEEAFGACTNVVYVPEKERIEAGYGDMTDIQMELALIRTALKSPVNWEYALMMDGSSWPTMPTEERRDWFRSRPRGTSQTFYRRPDGSLSSICPGHKCDRTPSRCVDKKCTQVTLTPHGLPIALGWQWIRLTRSLAKWMTESEAAYDWLDFFNDPPHADHPIVAPEEHVFGTLHWASPYRDQSDEEDFMYVDWANSASCRWWPNPRAKQSPCYLSLLDVGDVVRSGRPFMRKIASGDTAIRKVLPMSQIRPEGVPVWGEEDVGVVA